MRILMISNHLGVQSGVQRYVQNLLLNLDTTKYKVDLFVGLCPADQASTAPALIAHGVNIIGVPDHKKDRIRALYRHLKNHKNYDIIHYHTASKIGAPVCAMMRALCPRAKIIVHSHIVYPPITLTWRAAHGVYQLFADYFLGCGVAAGRFVFGDHIDRKPNFAVACNAVDQGRFHPDAAARAATRAAWAWRIPTSWRVSLAGSTTRKTRCSSSKSSPPWPRPILPGSCFSSVQARWSSPCARLRPSTA